MLIRVKIELKYVLARGLIMKLVAPMVLGYNYFINTLD